MPTSGTVPHSIVVAGGGLAAVNAVEALRAKGFDGRLVVCAAEQHLPYDRQPLSKEFLAPKTSPIAQAYEEAGKRLTLEDFTVHSGDWYRGHSVDLRLGTTVVALDPTGRNITVAGGDTVAYDKLLLATGSQARRLEIPGRDAEGVHYLRSVDDATALDVALVEGSRLGVVGAGWIGLEVAASARQRGVDVVVAGRSGLPLQSALGVEAAEVFTNVHRNHGVEFRMAGGVTEILTAGGRATALGLADGSTVAVDAVLVAAGGKPNTASAAAAGLRVEHGRVLTDAGLRTSDVNIYGAGDVVAVQNPLLNTRIHTEHWADARKQPQVVAAGMLGEPAEYAELPYFFTDQYELGMEYVGYAPDYHRVVFRGDVDALEFIAFWLDTGDRVLAGMNVNVSGVIGDIKALIRSRAAVSVDRLTDVDIPLPELHG